MPRTKNLAGPWLVEVVATEEKADMQINSAHRSLSLFYVITMASYSRWYYTCVDKKIIEEAVITALVWFFVAVKQGYIARKT